MYLDSLGFWTSRGILGVREIRGAGGVGMSDSRRDAPRASADLVRQRLLESAGLLEASVEPCADAIAAAAQLLGEALRDGRRVLTFGNGGSAADAQHFAAELSGRFGRERAALPALALTANSSDVTAIANDYGYERVFARLVEAHGAAGDVAVGISTSGESANVCEGVRAARDAGLHTLALTGRGGGKLAGLADRSIVVPSDVTARIQEVHGVAIHVLCEIVEETLLGGEFA